VPEARWVQVIDVEVIGTVTEWLLPGPLCPCCGIVTFAEALPGTHAGSVSYGAVLNAAAVVLTAYGNVPPERAAQIPGSLQERYDQVVRTGIIHNRLRDWLDGNHPGYARPLAARLQGTGPPVYPQFRRGLD
jgi:hypothetical protein